MKALDVTEELINKLVTEENNSNHGVIEKRRRHKPGQRKDLTTTNTMRMATLFLENQVLNLEVITKLLN